jgi:hypothetical protein
MDAVHTGVVQTKSNAGRADWFLFDRKKENMPCLLDVKQPSTVKKLEPICTSTSVNIEKKHVPD